MLMSENINELMASLSKAQGQISGAVKDSSNPFFKSKYADLNSIWNACREALSAHGLAVVQTVGSDAESHMFLHTILGHSSGQWISSTLPINIPASKEGRVNELQLLGSALTYLRRYALAAIVGVAPDEDDDGNAANGYKASPSKSYIKQEAVAEKVTTLNEKQTTELGSILDKCDPEFVTGFLTHAKNTHGANSLKDFPAHIFDKAKAVALDNRDVYQMRQKELAAGKSNE